MEFAVSFFGTMDFGTQVWPFEGLFNTSAGPKVTEAVVEVQDEETVLVKNLPPVRAPRMPEFHPWTKHISARHQSNVLLSWGKLITGGQWSAQRALSRISSAFDLSQL